MSQQYSETIQKIHEICKRTKGKTALDASMKVLKDSNPSFHWVGIYHLRGDALEVGPYYGPKTEHTRIPIGKGVCGTAIAEDKNQIITDVSNLDNYLACNLDTKAEIVVLIKDKNGKILGQIDIDGKEVGMFGKQEEKLLEQVADALAPHMG